MIDKTNIKTTDWLTKGMTKEQIAREKREAIMSADLEECMSFDIRMKKEADEKTVDYDYVAEKMVDKGYRKQSEVAREIISEILSSHTLDIDGFFTMHESELIELKKKYTGEKEDEQIH